MSSEHLYQQLSCENDKDTDSFEESKPVVLKEKSWRVKLINLTQHLLLLALYGLLTFLIIQYTHKNKVHIDDPAKYLTYSPARNALNYHKYVFNAAPDLTSPYVGDSRPSLDLAWHELLANTNMRVSAEDLQKINRTSIPLGNGGGYYGEMSVFHELHCLKFIRQAFHMEYYGHTFGKGEKEKLGEHTEHCIEILRQSVMCRGDTTLITFHWGQTIRLPQPDFTGEHECVNWDDLMIWAQPHAIDVFEEGMLMHPKFGPAYPGGFREDRPHPQEVK